MMKLQSPVVHRCGILTHPNSFRGAMFKLNVKLNADSPLLYLLRHFECDGHTVHMPTQQRQPPH